MNNEQFEYLMAFIKAIVTSLWIIGGIFLATFILTAIF